ncbi:unnamed protein product [marine sediment metagenome]|uniref:Uncharacterized protein n=1 Tax=marine sediment metagenome TaxID=412755 RepID=X0UQU6_9ZZZZ
MFPKRKNSVFHYFCEELATYLRENPDRETDRFNHQQFDSWNINTGNIRDFTTDSFNFRGIHNANIDSNIRVGKAVDKSNNDYFFGIDSIQI